MDTSDIMIIKRKSNNPNGRPIRAPWRYDSDGNLIIKNPTFCEYYKHNYINKYGCETICELCCINIRVKHIKRHQNSNICKKIRYTKDNNTESSTDTI